MACLAWMHSADVEMTCSWHCNDDSSLHAVPKHAIPLTAGAAPAAHVEGGNDFSDMIARDVPSTMCWELQRVTARGDIAAGTCFGLLVAAC